MKVITIGRSSKSDVVIHDAYVGRVHMQMDKEYMVKYAYKKTISYVLATQHYHGKNIYSQVPLSDIGTIQFCI